MKILKKASPIEVKRTFVVADQMAHVHNGKKFGNNRAFLKDITPKEFDKKVSEVKKKILKLKETDLDKLISPEYPKRLISYNASEWFIAEAGPHEIGVWRRAGKLPLR